MVGVPTVPSSHRQRGLGSLRLIRVLFSEYFA